MQTIERHAIRPMAIAIAVALVALFGAAVGGLGRAAAQEPPTQQTAERTQQGSQERGDPGRQRGGRGRGRGYGLRLWTRMPEEERDATLKFIEDHFPEVYEELSLIQETQPERFDGRMGRLVLDMRSLMRTMENEPALAALLIKERRLNAKIRVIAGRVRKAEDDSEGKKLQDELAKLVEEWYDVRLEHRAMEIRDTEERIAILRGHLKRSQDNREAYIQREVERRLLGWRGRGRGGNGSGGDGGGHGGGALSPPDKVPAT